MENLIETHVVKPEVSRTENGQLLRAINNEDEFYLDNKIKELDDFINNNHGLGKTEEEKDMLYAEAQSTWKLYVDRLRNMKYTFYLNRSQFNFLSNLLISKLEYTVDTVFLAVELTNMLGEWNEDKKFNNDTELKSYTCTATDITYMYHLIAPFKVKGLTKDTYTFVDILKKIGFISKILSYYDTIAKNFNKDIQDWAATFEEGVTIDGKPWGRSETEVSKETTKDLKVKKAKKEEA